MRRRMTSRIRKLRSALAERFGDEEFGVRACAARASISERSWWSYERGEYMPPADVALRIADVLGVTVRQLELRRLEGAEEEGSS
jgi:transcriptional regulator with XRE-family HTH domain